PPLPSISAVPLYAIGRLSARITGSGDTTGVFFVSVFNQLTTAAACAVFFLVAAALGFTLRTALVLTVFFGAGTLALPYSRTFFGEPSASLMLLASILFIIRFRQVGSNLMLLAAGCFLALAVVSHYTSVLLFVPFAMYVWFISPHKKSDGAGQKILRLATLALPCAIVFVLILFYNYARFGSPLQTGYEERFNTPLFVGLHGLLFSPGKSIFIYCPLVLAFFPATAAFRKSHSAESKLFTACAVIYLLIHAKWNLWGGDLSWGPRYLVPVVPMLILPLGALLDAKSRTPRFIICNLQFALHTPHYWLIFLFLLSFSVQIIGISIDFKQYYDATYMTERPSLEKNDLTNFHPQYAPVAGHVRLMSFLLCRTVNGEKCSAPFFNPQNDPVINDFLFNKLTPDLRIFLLQEKTQVERFLIRASYVVALLFFIWTAFTLNRFNYETKAIAASNQKWKMVNGKR
ncbi:MAG: hypothetical protein AB1546_16740, partial [bacterium]